MITLKLKIVIISVSLVSIIIPYFKTIYSLDVQQNSSDSGLEQIVLKAQFKPDENQFLAEDGYYQVQNFNFVASNDSQICPSNNCKYGVGNTQFRPNSISGGYVFEGRLSVTAIEVGVEKPEFYYFNVAFDKASEMDKNGTTVQILKTPSELGSFSFIPGIDYNIINATLLIDKENPILKIYGERAPH